MTDQNFAGNVVRRLDDGLENLSPQAAQRLQQAREAAVGRARVARTDAQAIASGGGAVVHHGWALGSRIAAPVLALVIAAVGMFYWQRQAEQIEYASSRYGEYADFADVDTDVLTGDLPVVAYLDPGFEIWLYHHAPASRQD